jgi:molybdate transport system substrate-binding protein
MFKCCHFTLINATLQTPLACLMQNGLFHISTSVILVAAFLFQSASAKDSQSLSIVAAANLAYVIEPLNIEFKKVAPEITVTIVSGSSGNLVTQIVNGAPYDVFLSADMDFPRELILKGYADPKSLRAFAVGRLVIWSAKSELYLSDVASVVRNPRITRIALANAITAPYGRAAKQALQKLGIWEECEAKYVFGENITQTTQFVATGNADAGFVALSVVLSPKLKGKGHWIDVPSELYSPLEQGAIITMHGVNNPAAQRYIDFLHSITALRILKEYGYRIPE